MGYLPYQLMNPGFLNLPSTVPRYFGPKLIPMALRDLRLQVCGSTAQGASTKSRSPSPRPSTLHLRSTSRVCCEWPMGTGWINLRKPLAHWAKKDPEMKVWTAKFVPTKYYYSIPKSFKFSHLRPSKTKRHRIYFATWYASENLEALQIIWVISR